MRICFLLAGLSRSGGVNAVVQHGEYLQRDHGHHVTLVLLDDELPAEDYGLAAQFEIILLSELPQDLEPFDIALATYWETAYWIADIPARRYAQFVQSLEDRFFPPRTPARTSARISLGLPLAIVTEADWIADVLGQSRPGQQIHLVHNGLDKSVFAPLDALPAPHDGPLRVIVEGHPDVWFKAVPEAKSVLEHMTQPYEAVYVVPNPEAFSGQLNHGKAEGPLSGEQLAKRYEWADLILKLSRVEGMFGPPLEAFHKGATCVVWPVTGHDQYIEHRVNGVVTDWDDLGGTARWLDLLASNRTRLREMQTAALETAKAWPSWQQAAVPMDKALRAIAQGPDGCDRDHLARISESVRAALGSAERYAVAMGTSDGRAERSSPRARSRLKSFVKSAMPGLYERLRLMRSRDSEAK